MQKFAMERFSMAALEEKFRHYNMVRKQQDAFLAELAGEGEGTEEDPITFPEKEAHPDCVPCYVLIEELKF